MVEKILTDTSKPALTAAIEANLFAMFTSLRNWPEAEIHDTPELLWLITEIPFPLFNSVFRARLQSDKIDDAIDSILAEYAAKNVPMMWWTGPSTQPSDLGSILSERGFDFSANPGMAIDLGSLPEDYPLPEDFQIKKVENKEELEIWNRVVCEVFEMPDFVQDAFFDLNLNMGFGPPYINYMGIIDNEIVATSSVFRGGGVAGIYNVAAIESVRRKGIGAAMTAIPLLEARSAGYRVGILESSNSGFNVYRKLGFQEYCKISHYVWMGDQ